MHAIKNSPKVTSFSMNWSLQKHQKLTKSNHYGKVEKIFISCRPKSTSFQAYHVISLTTWTTLVILFPQKQQKFTQICFKIFLLNIAKLAVLVNISHNLKSLAITLLVKRIIFLVNFLITGPVFAALSGKGKSWAVNWAQKAVVVPETQFLALPPAGGTLKLVS